MTKPSNQNSGNNRKGKQLNSNEPKQTNGSSGCNKSHGTEDNSLKPTKLDYAIANYMRDKLPSKEAMFVGIKRVNYFIGSKAVDLLMESKYSTSFSSRHEVVIFLNELLLKKFYHRARKIVRIDGTKKKFKLDMHDVQVFEDSNQPYVWLYEPVSLKAWLLCIGLIAVIIAICLFPLWPSMLRSGVYYICVAALCFLTAILVLIVLRHIIFFAFWTITFGNLHFWILPNLTEDCGFFESFWPLYTIDKGVEDKEGGATVVAGQEGEAAAHSHQD